MKFIELNPRSLLQASEQPAKELNIDFREQGGVCINGAEVEMLVSFAFLGVNITKYLVQPCWHCSQESILQWLYFRRLMKLACLQWFSPVSTMQHSKHPVRLLQNFVWLPLPKTARNCRELWTLPSSPTNVSLPHYWLSIAFTLLWESSQHNHRPIIPQSFPLLPSPIWQKIQNHKSMYHQIQEQQFPLCYEIIDFTAQCWGCFSDLPIYLDAAIAFLNVVVITLFCTLFLFALPVVLVYGISCLDNT